MSPSTTRVFVAAMIALAVWTIGAVISISARWPAQFGGVGDPNAVATEFLSRGTALAPPLTVMVVLVVFALLARSRRWWGVLGVVGLCVLAVLTCIGSLGEALAPPTPDVPRAVLLASGAIGGIVSLGLFGAAVADLLDRLRTSRSGPR